MEQRHKAKTFQQYVPNKIVGQNDFWNMVEVEYEIKLERKVGNKMCKFLNARLKSLDYFI